MRFRRTWMVGYGILIKFGSGADGSGGGDAARGEGQTEEEQMVLDKLRGVPKDTPVLMYCTGGIRCDVYSPVLREQGFTDLRTLGGGVQHYFAKEGGEGWKGHLYVFDARMAVGPDLDASQGPEGLECAGAGAAASCSREQLERIYSREEFLRVFAIFAARAT